MKKGKGEGVISSAKLWETPKWPDKGEVGREPGV